ncbi:uncharacterized protein BYT42DRAFT_502710 [Radiomyces spectabilis]|uniref:uncharacterized protein n=1 Tax=Radiomyces spectabilis TaxID=64574 RepID=UPI0022203FE4|nr:uncharacterized protein BYT42DRAFT_502710 [Radiomyces spectabilis]KAI8370582.1 hypothetical protein BYT42DRAFT_502710 [Radiomyces spectabilis]
MHIGVNKMALTCLLLIVFQIYGFQRDTDARKSKDNRDKETCRWYHPYFRPGRRDLFHLIRRKTPQYTRRKRAKVQKDLETVLNVGSEEESELNEDTHLHSPQATSSEVSETKVSDKSTQQKYRIQASHSNSGIRMTQQDKLQAQLLQMQRAHRDMHEYYKDKMTKAYNQMAAQQLRIEQLESILRSVQFPMNHYHTTSYTNSMIIDKQQQQQQQQQYGHYERMQMSHGAGNPTFGATNMLQPGIPPSTGNVPHSYFLSSTGETTPPMSNDDQLTDDVLNTTLTSAVTAAKEQEPSHSSFSAWMQSPLPHTDTPSVPVTMIDTHATDIAVQHHYAPARYSLGKS